MSENIYNVPIIFITFNKYNETIRVFNEIRKIKPAVLYIVSDGARPDKISDESVSKIRDYIENNVDWDCDLNLRWHGTNQGCKKSVSEGITWLFENEEYGIIIEDDCLPSQHFFRYMEEMLIKYQYNEQVMAVCGYRPMKRLPKPHNESYYFSKYVSFWGWGTWKQAWNKFDFEMADYTKQVDSGQFRKMFETFIEYKANKDAFDATVAGDNSSWGYRWAYTMLNNKGLAIYPYDNQIENIGFCSENATHTSEQLPDVLSDKIEEMTFPLIHPSEMVRNRVAEKMYSQKLWRKRVLLKMLSDFLKKVGLYNTLKKMKKRF
ncbi:hypothetical protein [Shewanella benthica]|uniref:Methyltransferase FkbM n=1 Tax=Shewanella benthica KT99 TaxID=314608 RepID=A9D4K1_9GAMM|nr:hypothetical protein [Shewanella benthica]EDQ01570.1 Methyltransferase FkbM [Shewanella benthica KT99]